MKKTKEAILKETYDRYEHRMADIPNGDEIAAICDAMDTYEKQERNITININTLVGESNITLPKGLTPDEIIDYLKVCEDGIKTQILNALNEVTK